MKLVRLIEFHFFFYRSSMVKTIYHEVILQDHFPTSIYRESLGCEKVPRQEVTINICLASRLLRLQRDSGGLTGARLYSCDVMLRFALYLVLEQVEEGPFKVAK